MLLVLVGIVSSVKQLLETNTKLGLLRVEERLIVGGQARYPGRVLLE